MTFSLTEKALLVFKSKNNMNLEDIEMVLRQVREHMDVELVSRQEKKEKYLVHKDPRKNFSRWLACCINL